MILLVRLHTHVGTHSPLQPPHRATLTECCQTQPRFQFQLECCRRLRIDVRPTAAFTGRAYSHSSRAASHGSRRLPRHAARLAPLACSR